MSSGSVSAGAVEVVRTPHFVQEFNGNTEMVFALRRPARDEMFYNSGGGVSDDIVFEEAWGENTYQISREWLQGSGGNAGGLVVDIGANIGAVTLLCLAIDPFVHVIAIEPEPENCALLRQNIALNGWENRVSVVEAAVGPYPGSCSMGSGGGAAFVQAAVPGMKTGGIPVRTLPDICQGLESISLLKFDTEGSEYEFLGPQSDGWGVVQLAEHIVGEFHSTKPGVWGGLIGHLAETHHGSWIGTPKGGGQIWAHLNH